MCFFKKIKFFSKKSAILRKNKLKKCETAFIVATGTLYRNWEYP